MALMAAVVGAIVVSGCAAGDDSGAAKWVAGSRSAVISPYEQIKLTQPRSFADETVRQVLHMGGGGDQIRIRLTNRYGRAPLTIGAARVALRKSGADVIPETDTVVRFGGATTVTIPAGADIVSDDVALMVEEGVDLALSLYLPQPTGPATFEHMAIEDSYVLRGNHVGSVGLAGAQTVGSRFFVSGVDVRTDRRSPVAVAFGDSWFEGVGTTPGTNHRFPDLLNRRWEEGWVVNQGISGNRLLVDEVGEHALGRFDRDVREVPGATHVLVNFGINDLGLPGMVGKPPAAASDLIVGFTMLAKRAHEAGLRIVVATIGPFGGAIFPGIVTPEGLATRRVVNEWLRTTDLFDGVFDVDRAVADPARPDYLRPEFDSGDGMHLNDAGTQAMADSVDLTTLRG